jgi:hypothetical protein
VASDIPPLNFCFLFFQFLLLFLSVSKRLDERLEFFKMRFEKFLVMLPAADSAFIEGGVFVPIPSAILVFALSVSIRG